MKENCVPLRVHRLFDCAIEDGPKTHNQTIGSIPSTTAKQPEPIGRVNGSSINPQSSIQLVGRVPAFLVNDEAIIAFWTVQRMGTDDVKSASIRGSAGLFGT